MSNERLAPTQAASASVEVTIRGDDHAFISASGLSTGESIPIEILQGGSWAPLKWEGVAVTIDGDNTGRSIQRNGRYRANKPVTALAVGIYVSRRDTDYS